jgi:ferric-dicitrate binding protein FerR (iron transport regulator)
MDQEKLMEKWLNNDLSEAERKAFDALEDASFFKDIIADASHFKASHFSAMADFDTFKKRSMQPEQKVRKIDWFKPMMRVASIVVAVLGLYYIFTSNSLTEVQTQVAEKTSISLPDASQVTINAQSEVAYNEKEWATKREITLKGEAFFDVAKGARFDVVTESGTVSVLGTEFNVKQRGSFFEVACFEGTVQVATNEGTVILHVGDNMTLMNGLLTTGTNTFDEPQWTQNKSYFQRTPVSEVFAELERQYGVTVGQENVNTDQLFTGGFDHNNLSQAIKAIGEPLNLAYQINGKEVLFSTRN